MQIGNFLLFADDALLVYFFGGAAVNVSKCLWGEVKDYYRNLIIGNGLSISVSNVFSYRSLYDYAERSDLFKDEVYEIFDHLKTHNFEEALDVLSKAYVVNQIMGLECSEIQDAMNEVRSGLIESVRNLHSDFHEIKSHVGKIANRLLDFEKVFSLNYDLITYWSIIEANKDSPNRVKDCFKRGGMFEQDWGYLAEPYGRNDKSTLVFYPHGNLALVSNREGREEKVSTDGAELIDTILYKYEEGGSPLFVSEGSSNDKLSAIFKSKYLSNVYRKALPRVSGGVAIFGWSMSDCDSHICEAILSNQNVSRLAISVYKLDSGKLRSQEYSITHLLEKYGRDIDVDIFDADSFWL